MTKLLDLPEGEWTFTELRCDDPRGMGYVSIDGVDILHTGEARFWANQNRAIGQLAAAAPDLFVALEGMTRNYDGWNDVELAKRTDPPTFAAVKVARSALAKAKGET